LTDNLPIPSKGTPFKREDAILPQGGQYWIYNPKEDEGRGHPVKGRAYLVKQVHVIDGEIHSLETAHHPESGQGGVRISIDEFLEKFEYTEQGEAIRAAEIGKVTATISKLQRLLADHTREASGPPQDDRAGMLTGPRVNSPDTVNALVTSGKSVAEMTQGIEARRQTMLDISERITETAKSIETETKKLARFYQEKAGAALASVNDVLLQAEHLKKGITTLGLFAGDGVEVNLVRDGKPATGEKLALRQLKLHLDEELVCHIDDEGGADYTAINDLGALFDRDPDLLDRMIPEKLGVVLMRFRRNDKQYSFSWARGINSDIADMLANIEENALNKEQVLLVRNGEKVWEVRATDALQNIPRLFPRERDLDDVYRQRSHAFRGIESSMITPKDLQYVEARGKFEQMALEYRRVLVLLWGLDQRLQLFGHFFDRQRHQTFLTAEFQEECLKFIADEEDVLVEGRPSVHRYRETLNLDVEAGSRIIVRWRDMINMESCPAMVEINQRTYAEQLKYNLRQERELVTVERRGGKLMVPVEATHPWRDTVRKFYVDIDRGDLHSYITLDAMRTEDIRWYLANRVARADYLSYIRTFLMAYDVLKPQEEAEASAVEDMIERSGGPAKRTAVMKALTHWRISSADKVLPVGEEGALEKTKRTILEHAELLSGNIPDENLEMARKISDQSGSYRVGLTIGGEYVATRDHPDRPANVPFPWVQEQIFSKNGKLIRERFHRANLERTDVVQLIEGKSTPQDQTIAKMRRREYDGEDDPSSIIAVMKAINQPETTDAWRMIMEPETIAEERDSHFRMSRKPKGRNEPVHCDLPLAITRHRDYVSVLYLSVRPIDAMAALGGESGAHARQFYDTWFAFPEKAWGNLIDRGPIGFETSSLTTRLDLKPALGNGGHMDRPEYALKDAEVLEKTARYDEIMSRLIQLGWMKPEKEKN